MKQIIFLLFPGLEIMDFAGPLQTFAEAKNLGCDLTVRFCSWQKEVCASQNVYINKLLHFTDIKTHPEDIIIIPGLEHEAYSGNALERIPHEIFNWLITEYHKKTHICSICSGAFVLAHTGLLKGKKCTTHWSRTAELQNTYPEINVMSECLFVHDSGIYTSAGVTSGIDMSLAMVEKNWGPHIASKVARELVVYIRRNGDHHQKSVYMDFRDHLNPEIHKVQDWLISNPGKTYTLNTLANRFGMSERNLTRVFKKATGVTIKQYTTLITLEHAKSLLQNPDNTVESTALSCGFHDARHLRRLWKKHFGTSPSQIRPGI